MTTTVVSLTGCCYTNGNRKVVADYLGHSVSNLTEWVYVTTSDRFMEQSIRDFVL